MEVLMPTISSLTSKVESSGTLAIKAVATELKLQGKEIIEFTAGEPDFVTPEKIKNAAIRALEENFTKYTSANGILELREAICEKLKTENVLEYTPDQVIVTNGAKHAIYLALQVILNPGDEVIVSVPYWTSYPEQVKMCYGIPRFVDTRSTQFKLTPERLEEAITDKTKAIIINSPSNPSGAVYTRDEIQKLADVLKKYNIFIISDEIYEKIIFDGRMHYSFAAAEELYERTILINGFSKAYSMTGWRAGYAAGPLKVINEMKKYQGHQTSNVNSITQKACVVALKEVAEEVEFMRQQFEKRRDLIYNLISKIPYVKATKPQGAFYLFPDFTELCAKLNLSSYDLVKKLIKEANIVAVPGEAFGTPGFIRFSFATSEEEIEKGMYNLLKFVQSI